MTHPVRGSCLCRAVTYEITGRISAIAYCHCSKCRKANGSAFHSGAVCRKTKFRWLSGEDRISRFSTESGYGTCFCNRCGSPVPMHLDEDEFVVIHAGGLDGEPELASAFHFFVGSKAPWFTIGEDGLPRHEEEGRES